MQTFSNMRRNRAYKHALIAIFAFLALWVYESLATMWLYAPPLIGVAYYAFVRFSQASESKSNIYIFIAIICGLFIIEAENDLPFGLLLGLFTILSLFIMPRLQVLIGEYRIYKLSCVFVAYIGLFVASCFIYLLFKVPIPSLWILLYFMIVELALVVWL